MLLPFRKRSRQKPAGFLQVGGVDDMIACFNFSQKAVAHGVVQISKQLCRLALFQAQPESRAFDQPTNPDFCHSRRHDGAVFVGEVSP